MEAALPLADYGDVECRNILKPLPDRATASAERLSDLTFARKPVTALELSTRSHFFGHALSRDWLQAGDQVRLARVLHAGLPSEVTSQTSLLRCLEAGRHRGLTEQGIMSLSGHNTPEAARLYVHKTEKQRRAAARRRCAYFESEQKQVKSQNRAAAAESE
jgi:hypothetical protein